MARHGRRQSHIFRSPRQTTGKAASDNFTQSNSAFSERDTRCNNRRNFTVLGTFKSMLSYCREWLLFTLQGANNVQAHDAIPHITTSAVTRSRTTTRIAQLSDVGVRPRGSRRKGSSSRERGEGRRRRGII